MAHSWHIQGTSANNQWFHRSRCVEQFNVERCAHLREHTWLVEIPAYESGAGHTLSLPIGRTQRLRYWWIQRTCIIQNVSSWFSGKLCNSTNLLPNDTIERDAYCQLFVSYHFQTGRSIGHQNIEITRRCSSVLGTTTVHPRWNIRIFRVLGSQIVNFQGQDTTHTIGICACLLRTK